MTRMAGPDCAVQFKNYTHIHQHEAIEYIYIYILTQSLSKNSRDRVSPLSCMIRGFRNVCMVFTYYSKGKDQPGKVANPARGQLNRKNVFSPVPVRA